MHEYDHDPRAPAYGLEAAERLGLDPARVLKTLVAALDSGDNAVALVPAASELDLKALAAAAGRRGLELSLADLLKLTAGRQAAIARPVPDPAGAPWRS